MTVCCFYENINLMKKGIRIAYKPAWLKEIKGLASLCDLWNRKGTYIGPGKIYGKMKTAIIKWDDAPDAQLVNEKTIIKIDSTEFINTDLN